jgi:hypothetical protein
MLLPVRAAIDLCALSITNGEVSRNLTSFDLLIYSLAEHDSLPERVLRSLGTVIFLLYVSGLRAGVLVGCALSAWAAIVYLTSELGVFSEVETPGPRSKQVGWHVCFVVRVSDVINRIRLR